MEFKHKSVLLKETIDNLNVKPDGIYVDGTLGGAGHASEVCKLLSATGRLIGIDQDDAAIQAASERLRDYQDRTMIIRSNYCHMVTELKKRGINSVDGIVVQDLGGARNFRFGGPRYHLDDGVKCVKPLAIDDITINEMLLQN